MSLMRMPVSSVRLAWEAVASTGSHAGTAQACCHTPMLVMVGVWRITSQCLEVYIMIILTVSTMTVVIAPVVIVRPLMCFVWYSPLICTVHF